MVYKKKTRKIGEKKPGTLDCGKYGWLYPEEIMERTGMDIIDYSERILTDNAVKEQIIDGVE